MIKIQFRYFMVKKRPEVNESGLMIPRATSTPVTKHKKKNTPHILLMFDLNLTKPLKIFLNQIKESEDKYPHQIYKVPV
jgi:hypothetical protein